MDHKDIKNWQDSVATGDNKDGVPDPSQYLDQMAASASSAYTIATPQSIAQSSDHNASAGHTRTYQACIPCRSRKVRCDMGPVDDPLPPPCSRCRRESKDCTFATTRRKRAADSSHDEDGELDEYEVKNGKKRSTTAEGSPLRRPQCQASRSRSGSNVARTTDADTDEPFDVLKFLHNPNLFDHRDDWAMLEQYETEKNEHDRKVKERKLAAAGHVPPKSVKDSPDYQAGIEAWKGYPLVKSKWLTAEEALGYANYYYDHQESFTPIKNTEYKNPKEHHRLITEQPILATTILTIASRYKKIETHGALTRRVMVHNALWQFLKPQLAQVWLGRVDFGIGDSNADVRYGARRNAVFKTTQGLSIIVSLLLLTEWHPSAFHFPGNGVGNPVQPTFEGAGIGMSSEWRNAFSKSDQMCWTFLNNAVGLANQLGLFSKDDEFDEFNLNPTSEELACNRRKTTVRILLHIYTIQLSGRLGFISPLPSAGFEAEDLFDAEFVEKATEATSSFMDTNQARTKLTSRTADPDFVHNLTLWFWERLADITKRANAALYRSRSFTRQLLKSDNHRHTMQQFEDELVDFYQRLDGCNLVPAIMRQVLDVEFCYIRAYINQLAITAAVQRCMEQGTPPQEIEAGTTQGKPTKAVVNFVGAERPFVTDILQAAQKLLEAILNMDVSGGVKHASVRTYSRLMSTMLLMLKTFSCGTSRNDFFKSIKLFQAAIEALKKDIVDDMHVGGNVVALLERLDKDVRARTVRIPVKGTVHSINPKDARFYSIRTVTETVVQPEVVTRAPVDKPQPATMQQTNTVQPEFVLPQRFTPHFTPDVYIQPSQVLADDHTYNVTYPTFEPPWEVPVDHDFQWIKSQQDMVHNQPQYYHSTLSAHIPAIPQPFVQEPYQYYGVADNRFTSMYEPSTDTDTRTAVVQDGFLYAYGMHVSPAELSYDHSVVGGPAVAGQQQEKEMMGHGGGEEGEEEQCSQ